MILINRIMIVTGWVFWAFFFYGIIDASIKLHKQKKQHKAELKQANDRINQAMQSIQTNTILYNKLTEINKE